MNMKSFFIILFVVLLNIEAYGQHVYKGHVTNANNEPVEFANVLVETGDSSGVHGTVCDINGDFKLQSDKENPVVKISSVGYVSKIVALTGDTTNVIRLDQDMNILNEVVVKAQRPQYELSSEGMITNVAGSILEKSSDAYHLLSLVPGIEVKGESLNVLGRGKPIVYINGRLVRNDNEIATLQPDAIKKVEVITNPGAKYNANVTSVIKITTKKNSEGFALDSKSTFVVNEKGRPSFMQNILAGYHIGKWDFNGQLYGAYTQWPDDKYLAEIAHLDNKMEVRNNGVQSRSKTRPYGKLSVDYALNDESSMGASVSYDRTLRLKGNGTIYGSMLKDDITEENLTSDYTYRGHSGIWSGNVYYLGKIGVFGIDFNGDFLWNKNNEDMATNDITTLSSGETDKQNINTSRTDLSRMLAGKLVLDAPVWKGRLSYGLEYSYVRRNSDYSVIPQDVVDGEQSLIKEGMGSMFLDYTRKFGKLSFQAGLRYENVDFKYYDHSVLQKAQSKNYSEWFPSASLSWPIHKVNFQLTYASDIYRPSYYQLRDGVVYDNRYTYESGNPFLNPSISRNLGLSVSWKWLYFSGMFSRVTDEICSMRQLYKDKPNAVLTIYENAGDYNNMRLQLSASPTIGIWHPRVSCMFYKQWDYPVESYGASTSSINKPSVSCSIANIFDFNWLTATVTYSFQSKGNFGNVQIVRPAHDLDLSFYKALLHKSLILQLDVYDLLGTNDSYSKLHTGPMFETYYNEFSTSTVTLSVRYKFNVLKNKYKGTGAGQAQKSRM